jgi:cell division septal protein FtsQ
LFLQPKTLGSEEEGDSEVLLAQHDKNPNLLHFPGPKKTKQKIKRFDEKDLCWRRASSLHYRKIKKK